MVDVIVNQKLDLLHVHYAIPHASAAYMAKKIVEANSGRYIPVITTLHGTDITNGIIIYQLFYIQEHRQCPAVMGHGEFTVILFNRLGHLLRLSRVTGYGFFYINI